MGNFNKNFKNIYLNNTSEKLMYKNSCIKDISDTNFN